LIPAWIAILDSSLIQIETAVDGKVRAAMKDPLIGLPGYVLRRAAAAALAELNQRLAPLALRHSDAAFLILIDASPGITQSTVGRILDIQRANMVPFLARQERRGWVKRKRVDGRTQSLMLTSDGRSVLAKARAIIDDFEAALIKRVPRKLRAGVMPTLLALWNRPTQEVADP
jgi:DNA-binding MarR family transcriptional regulator